MDDGMTRERWLSLGLQEHALPVFEAGSLVVGIPKSLDGHHLLGAVSSHEEAAVVATILRLFNPS